MNSLQSGIGPEENLTYETQGINFQNNPQAKSKNRGKPLYILTAKKNYLFFGIIQTLLGQALAGKAS